MTRLNLDSISANLKKHPAPRTKAWVACKRCGCRAYPADQHRFPGMFVCTCCALDSGTCPTSGSLGVETPGGWEWVCPKCGWRIIGGSQDVLKMKVELHQNPEARLCPPL